MNDIHRTIGFAAVLLAAALIALGCGGDREALAGPDEHGAHEEHGDDESPEGHDDETREGHDAHEERGAHDGHDDHGGEEGSRVELTREQRRRIGLALATAGPGRIGRDLSFPGEISLNPDRVAHVVPRAAGIVREVGKTLGDRVEEGEVLARIESADLAGAKLDYYAREAELGCCMVELPRAKRIFLNVNRLLGRLAEDPGDEELAALGRLPMGDHGGRILTAHADLVAATKAFERERTLREKDISSDQDLVAAQADLRRARAAYDATLETARYEVLVAFGEAARARQVAEFEAAAAEQQLRLRGVGEDAIGRLRDLVPKTATLEPCNCGDPACRDNEFPSVRGRLAQEGRLGWYALTAPFAGVVIEKHLTLGEKVGEDESVFAVADTSTVWAVFSVFQKDLALVSPGQSATVELAGDGSHRGTVAYLSPIVDPETRAARARVVLGNAEGRVRPGLFVTVRVALPETEAAVVVPRTAVQIIEEREVVFVAEGDGFEAVPVELGHGDRDRVVVVRGLAPGTRYVTTGAFELKAKIATSGLGAHAGHGH